MANQAAVTNLTATTVVTTLVSCVFFLGMCGVSIFLIYSTVSSGTNAALYSTTKCNIKTRTGSSSSEYTYTFSYYDSDNILRNGTLSTSNYHSVGGSIACSYLKTNPDSVVFGVYTPFNWVTVGIAIALAATGILFFIWPFVQLLFTIFMWKRRKIQKPTLSNYRI
eukprot:gene8350-175_t